MNSYNIFSKENPATILYHSIAEDKEHVEKLAKELNINIEGLTIDLERENVKDQLGRPYSAFIFPCQIQ